MDKLVGAPKLDEQLLPGSLPQVRADRLLRCPVDDRKCRDFGHASEAGKLLQSSLGLNGEAGQLPDHQVHHIVGVTLGVNAIEIPGPSRSTMIEGEQALFGERRNELKREKRVASRLLMHQLRERGGTLQFAAKRIRNQLLEVFAGKRSKRDLLYPCTGVLDSLKLAHQRMRGIDLVVSISADQHQVLQIRSGQEILQQVESRRVEPLQVVEEQSERVFRPSEYADKPPEHHLETPLCVLRFKIRDWWLFSEDEFQFRNQIHNEHSVRTQRLTNRLAPDAQLGLALGEKGADEALKGLRQRGIGDVPLVLIELAGREQAARRNEHLMQLIDDGGLANT